MQPNKTFFRNNLVILLALSFLFHLAVPHDHHFEGERHHQAEEHGTFHCHSLNDLTIVKKSLTVKTQKSSSKSIHLLDFVASTGYKPVKIFSTTAGFADFVVNPVVITFSQAPIRGSPLI